MSKEVSATTQGDDLENQPVLDFEADDVGKDVATHGEAQATSIPWYASRPVQLSGAALCVAGLTLGLVLGLAVDFDDDGGVRSSSPVAAPRRSLIEAPSSASCDIKVEVAQYFNVTKVPETDSTVALNIFNKRAYVLTPENSASAANVESLDLSALIPGDYKTSYLSTPLKNVTVTETQLITYIELLQKRTSISQFSQYATSPCLWKMQSDNLATTFTGNTYDTSGAQLTELQGSPTFVGYLANGEIAPETIQCAVSKEQAEGSMVATSEWIKFFGPFFQQECLANEIFEGIQKRYDCHKAKSDVFAKDYDPITVAIASKSEPYDYGPGYQSDGFYKISDAGYWTRYIKDAGAIPIVETSAMDGLSNEGGSGYKFNLSDAAAFHKVLESADIVIDETYFPGSTAGITADEILAAYDIPQGQRSSFKFVQDKALWRTDGRVNGRTPQGDDWFETRYPEADVLLEDIIFALHPTYSSLIINPRHTLKWLRNMYSAPAQEILSEAMCLSVSEPAQLIADNCTSFKDN